MADLLGALSPRERDMIDRLASTVGVPPDALIPAMVSEYLRLAADVQRALPADPLRGLAARARARA